MSDSRADWIEQDHLEEELKKIEEVQMMEAIKASALMTVKDKAQSQMYSDGLPTKYPVRSQLAHCFQLATPEKISLDAARGN
jgi:hypothetical protein